MSLDQHEETEEEETEEEETIEETRIYLFKKGIHTRPANMLLMAKKIKPVEGLKTVAAREIKNGSNKEGIAQEIKIFENQVRKTLFPSDIITHFNSREPEQQSIRIKIKVEGTRQAVKEYWKNFQEEINKDHELEEQIILIS